MKAQRKSSLHNFYDVDGDPIKISVLAAALGVTAGTVRNRLRAWSKANGQEIPSDMNQFLRDALG